MEGIGDEHTNALRLWRRDRNAQAIASSQVVIRRPQYPHWRRRMIWPPLYY